MESRITEVPFLINKSPISLGLLWYELLIPHDNSALSTSYWEHNPDKKNYMLENDWVSFAYDLG